MRRGALQKEDPSKGRQSLEGLRADAIAFLLSGKPDAAVTRLSRAVEIAPDNAVVRSDLAAARLHRSEALSDPYDLFLALAAANRALHLDPSLLAAAYNRALALQRLSLDARAREEWQRYQAREPDQFWWEAAQAHAFALLRSESGPTREASLEAVQRAAERGDQREVQEIVARSPRVLREYAEQDLLAAWAKAEGENRAPESEKLLRTARLIGAALAGTNGEHMIADTVSQIDDLRKTAPQDLSRLVQSFRVYGQALPLAYERGDYGRALPFFETAHRLLAEQRSPFAGWATYRIASCRYQHGEYDRALALLHPLFQGPASARYMALQGRARWLEGLIASIQGHPTEALTASEAALAAFRTLGEHSHAARMAGQVAVVLDVLGRRSDAWRRLQPALIEPATHESPHVLLTLHETASTLAAEEGELEIALWFQKEAVRDALSIDAAYLAVDSLRTSSALYAALGEKDAAAAEAEKARRLLDTVPDPQVRRILDGDLRLVEARSAASPREALALLDQAVRIFHDSAYHFQLAQALSERARAHEALSESAEAERDLAGAIEEFELQREHIGDPEARIAYFDRARETLDAMLLLQMEQRGRPEAAFRYSEQAKSRTLLDWVVAHPFEGTAPESVQAAEPGVPDPGSLQADLPADTVVVEYAALPQKLVIWVLRRSRFDVETVAIGVADLEKKVSRLTHDMSEGRKAAFLKTSSELYDSLLRPIEKYLAPGDRIVAVPDGPLHSLPFAVLRKAETKRYLIQDHICSVAPSARLLIASLQRDKELERRRDPRALVVVDPAFDREVFPLLRRLEASRAEARAASFFPGSQVLSDHAATRDAFLRTAGDFEILHFGGHSLVNVEFPLLSQMLFATEPGDPARGVLYSGDLLRQHFAHTRLAVLASCSTAGGRISRTEGVQSLARPFLAAGVPAVVASLWDVEDTRTAELFDRFYRHLQESFDPAAALQKAQAEAIEHGADEAAEPLSWGAFEVIGGINAPRTRSPSRPTTEAPAGTSPR